MPTYYDSATVTPVGAAGTATTFALPPPGKLLYITKITFSWSGVSPANAYIDAEIGTATAPVTNGVPAGFTLIDYFSINEQVGGQFSLTYAVPLAIKSSVYPCLRSFCGNPTPYARLDATLVGYTL